MTIDTRRHVFSQILKIKNKQKLEECTDKPLKNWLNPMKFKNEWFTECKLSIILKENRRLYIVQRRKKTAGTTNEKNADIEEEIFLVEFGDPKDKKTQRKRKCRNSSRQKRRERRRARLKRTVRTNSGAISMSEVKASSMAEPVSTKKEKKNSESTEPARPVSEPCRS